MKILLISLLFAGCGKVDRLKTQWTGSLTYKCSKSGVEYVQSDSGLAVHIDRNGNPIGCQN